MLSTKTVASARSAGKWAARTEATRSREPFQRRAMPAGPGPKLRLLPTRVGLDALGAMPGTEAVDGVVSPGEREDPLVNLRGLRGFDHLVIRRIGAGELDVVADAER